MGWTTAQSYLPHGFVDVCEIFIRRPWVLIEPFDRRPGGVARLELQMLGRRRHHHAVRIDTWPQPLVVESSSQALLTASWRSSHPRLGLGAGRALLQLEAMSKRDACTSMTLTIERRRGLIPQLRLTNRRFNDLVYTEGRRLARTVERALESEADPDQDIWLLRLLNGDVEDHAS